LPFTCVTLLKNPVTGDTLMIKLRFLGGKIGLEEPETHKA